MKTLPAKNNPNDEYFPRSDQAAKPQPFSIDFEDRRTYFLIRLAGSLDSSAQGYLQKGVEIARAKGYGSIAFEISRVTCDNAAIQAWIARLHATLCVQGGSVHLIGSSDNPCPGFSRFNLKIPIQHHTTPESADQAIVASPLLYEKSGLTIIRIRDTIEVRSIAAIRALVESSLKKGTTRLVIDLTRCTMLGSCAIGLLANVHKVLTAKNGRLALVGAHGSTYEVLEQTNIFKFLSNYPSLDEAAAALISPAQAIGTEA